MLRDPRPMGNDALVDDHFLNLLALDFAMEKPEVIAMP